MVVIGKNILENLTTGMYADSKIIFREYIQNACDQIDLAYKNRILDEGEGIVDIFIDEKARYISIKDNATGVEASRFASELGNIADSNKQIGSNKGFRGIGRLCGLAYCKTLIFKTSYRGEKIKSIMKWDADIMRKMLAEPKKYSIDEIIQKIVTIETDKENDESHYFEVELIDVNTSNTELLDEEKIRSFLSFVAPSPYKSTFIFKEKVHEHAKTLGYKLDEYCIKVNGAQILKEYTTNLKETSGNTQKKYDEIKDVEFEDFYDSNNNLLAWMWLGLSSLEKQIPKINSMRGIRIRTANIQIGEDDVLKKFFPEDRGTYYYVGEVFSVSRSLIPNSQRNYFNENDARLEFEEKLTSYFSELGKLYRNANELKNAYKNVAKYNNLSLDYQMKSNNNGFINEDDKIKQADEVEKSKVEAEKAKKVIKKHIGLDNDSKEGKVFNLITNKYKTADQTNNLNNENPNRNNDLSEPSTDTRSSNSKNAYITQVFSKLDKKERKLISKVMAIITDEAPKDIAQKIIERIKEEFQK